MDSIEPAKDLAKETAKETAKDTPTPADTPGVDLCVMLDCTGSMGSYIQMSKNKIKDIIQQVKASYPNSEVRVSIVGYRDIKDGNRFEVFPFDTDTDKAKGFLEKLQASGGNDTPEDVNGAFQKALYTLKWENTVRLLVLVADAPCHGKEYHSCDDDFPKGHSSDKSWDQMFKDLVDMRLDFLFLRIANITDTMYKKFRQHAEKYKIDELGISFNQEEANGGKASASKEEGFASVITGKIKESVEKELKAGLKKRLEKRTEENAELIKTIRTSISETVAKLNLEDLRTKYDDLIKKTGECILSSNNFVDALADEDCLCLTFDIGRSGAAIMDPTQIVIKNVYPSFLTAGSFFYSTEFALKKNKLAHGGYEKYAEGMIVKGAASENITGVMPLFFCEENWPIAKQLMKITLGWDVTLEPAGYTYLQMKTVPFLILAKLAEMRHSKPDSDFLKFQFELVKETCMRIMKDGSKEEFETKFNKDVIDIYNKYLTDTSVRTVDIIASNTAFLTQVYIAIECGYLTKDESYFDKIFPIILEEELRRRQQGLPETFDTNEWLTTLLDVNVNEHITKPVDKYLETFLKEEEEEEGKTDKPADPRSKEEIEYDLPWKVGTTFNGAQTKALEDYKETLKRVMHNIYPLRMLLTSKKAENPNDFREWGIESNFQFFALYIQNKLHYKNASRREAYSGNTYKNPWTQSHEYIRYWYNKVVEDAKSGKINKFLADMKSSKSLQEAATFAKATTLSSASKKIMGICIGVNVKDYMKALNMVPDDTPFLREKYRMLFTGTYEGVNLYKDSTSGWVPSAHNSSDCFRAHMKLFAVDEWKGLLPKISTTFMCYMIK